MSAISLEVTPQTQGGWLGRRSVSCSSFGVPVPWVVLGSGHRVRFLAAWRGQCMPCWWPEALSGALLGMTPVTNTQCGLLLTSVLQHVLGKELRGGIAKAIRTPAPYRRGNLHPIHHSGVEFSGVLFQSPSLDVSDLVL